MTKRIPRLAFEDLDEEVAGALAAKYQRLGYLGEFFQCMGHQPRGLKAFIDYTDAAKGALPDKIVELVALTVAARFDVAYERHQHERLSVRLGFGKEWVAAVERLDPQGAAELDETERLVQRYVLAALEDCGRGDAPRALEPVVEALGPEQTVAMLMVLGRYASHALIVNSLEITSPVPSIFDPGSDI
jgi:hypothetical protein